MKDNPNDGCGKTRLSYSRNCGGIFLPEKADLFPVGEDDSGIMNEVE